MSWYWAAEARGLLVFSRHQMSAQLAGQAAGKSHQALRMLGQKIFADSRFPVEAMQGGFGSNPHQVAVPLLVFG